MSRLRWYLGLTGRERVAFSSHQEPTTATHSLMYGAVIGPFDTKRGAMWAQNYGRNNPHFRHVRDAERIARLGGKV